MKKLFITSGAMGEYNLFENALITAGFDMSNDSHIIVFLGDMLGITEPLNPNLRRRRQIEFIQLYISLAQKHRIYYIMGQQEKMFKDLLEDKIDMSVIRKYVIKNNFLEAINDFIGLDEKVFEVGYITRMASVIKDYIGDMHRRVGLRIEKNCALKLFDSMPLWFETENYIMSYGDVTNIIGPETTFEQIKNEENDNMLKWNNKNMIVGKPLVDEVRIRLDNITRSLAPIQAPNFYVHVFEDADKTNYCPLMLSPKSLQEGGHKIYLNSNVKDSNKVNIFVIEDNLIEPSSQENIKDTITDSVKAENISDIGITVNAWQAMAEAFATCGTQMNHTRTNTQQAGTTTVGEIRGEYGYVNTNQEGITFRI